MKILKTVDENELPYRVLQDRRIRRLHELRYEGPVRYYLQRNPVSTEEEGEDECDHSGRQRMYGAPVQGSV